MKALTNAKIYAAYFNLAGYKCPVLGVDFRICVYLITGVIYVVKFLFPEKNPLYPAFPYIVVSLYFI